MSGKNYREQVAGIRFVGEILQNVDYFQLPGKIQFAHSLPPLKLYYIPLGELFDESEKFGEISEIFQRKVSPRF